MPVQNTDRNTQWLLNQPNQTWTLTRNATITTVDEHAIYEGQAPSEIVVKGDIKVTGSMYAGIEFDGADSSVRVGGDAVIVAHHGIWAGGAGSDIVNHGVIRGAATGVRGQIWVDLRNFGRIAGDNALYCLGEGSQIYNYGMLDGRALGIISEADGTHIMNGAGAEINGVDAVILKGPGDAEIVNKGMIRAEEEAIDMFHGNLHLVNRGRIIGDIELAGDTNLIDTRGGGIRGRIDGGAGDDTILVSSRIRFTDGNDSDYDRVSSSVSYKIGLHVEALDLKGKANIDATGSALDNDLTGNSGNNRIRGLNGADNLYGGKGNDVLTGGMGSDTFHFEQGYDVDRITDFEDGSDLIASQMVQSQQDFDNLNIRQTQAGVVINFGNGDRLIIDDVLKSDITYADFV